MDKMDILNAYVEENRLPQGKSTRLSCELAARFDFENCTDSQLIDLVIGLSEEENYDYFLSTIQTVKDYYNWCIEHGYTNFNPFESPEMLNVDRMSYEFLKRSTSRVITYDDMESILATLDTQDLSKHYIALFKVLFLGCYEGAFRTLSDMVKLKITDIDFNNHTIKRNRDGEWWKISDELVAYMLDYRKFLGYKERNGFEYKRYKDNFVFCSSKSKYEDDNDYNNKVANSLRQYDLKFKHILSKKFSYKISLENLFKSNFVQYVYKRLAEDGYDADEYYTYIFMLDHEMGKVNNVLLKNIVDELLRKYFKEYGLESKDRGWRTRQRKMFYLMARKSEHWDWKKLANLKK